MNKKDIDKAYVSEYDKFLQRFDATHEKSLSQQKEINKHQRIARLRDGIEQQAGDSPIWSDF